MKNTGLITKIALGVSIAALLFSIVTFIRSLILNVNIFLGAILVVGTAIIVVICAVMLYFMNNYESVDEADDSLEADEADDTEDSPAEAAETTASAASEEPADEIEAEVNSLIANLSSESAYDLSNFE